ncbi:MAG: hypothetical protein N2595_02535 [bacterium]|nr:hypothetical protein [bacterium]
MVAYGGEVVITRQTVGAPFVDITNAPFFTTLGSVTVAGTNNAHVVGWMWGSNVTTSARVNFLAQPAWTTPSISLASGQNDLRVYGTNAAGETAYDTVMVTRDNDPPMSWFSVPSADYATGSSGSVVITLRGTDAWQLALAVVSNVTPGSVSELGRWQLSTGVTNVSVAMVALREGMNTFRGFMQDAAGNRSTDAVRQIFVDLSDPSIRIRQPVDTAVAQWHTMIVAQVSLSGTADDPSPSSGFGAFVWSNRTAGSGGVITGGYTWSTPAISCIAGTNVIRVWARDMVGRMGSDMLNVFYDAYDPAVTVTVPGVGNTYTTQFSTMSLGGYGDDPEPSSGIGWYGWSNMARGVAGTLPGGPTWLWTDAPLTSGWNQILIWAVDKAGRTGPATVVQVLVDDRAPTAVITNPTAAGGITTMLAVVSFGGTADDPMPSSGFGAFVWSNTTVGLGGTTAGGSTWNVTNVAMARGVNVFRMWPRDQAGNVGTGVSVQVFSDQDNPAIAITNYPEGVIVTTTFSSIQLAGTASDAAPSSGWGAFLWSNETVGVGGTFGGSVSWTSPGIPLAGGTNVIRVWAVDASGRRSAPATRTVFYNTDSPTIVIESPNGGNTWTTALNNVTISGIATQPQPPSGWDSFLRAVNGIVGEFAGGDTWSFSAALNAGNNTIQVWSRTLSGAISAPDSMEIFSDQHNPSVVITTMGGQGFTTGADRVTLNGTANDPEPSSGLAGVVWSNMTRNVGGFVVSGTNWSVADILLQAGTNQLRVWSRDRVGRESSAAQIVVFSDQTNPVIKISSPTGAGRCTVIVAAVVLAGTAEDTPPSSGLGALVWSNRTAGAGGSLAGSNSWNAGFVTLVAGTNVITVTVSDRAGRSGSDVVEVWYDASNPVIQVTSPSGGGNFTTALAQVTFGGTASDPPPTFGLGNVLWSNRTTRAHGSIAASSTWGGVTVGLTAGVNQIQFLVTDAAGRTSQTVVVEAFSDQANPVVTITAPAGGNAYTTSSSSVTWQGTMSDPAPSSGWDMRGWSNVTSGATGELTSSPWSVVVVLTSGWNTLVAYGRDRAGRSGNAAQQMLFDNVRPEVSVTDPAAWYTVTNVDVYFVRGTATDGLSGIAAMRWTNYASGSGPIGLEGLPTWEVYVPLTVGSNVLVVSCEDGAGNVSNVTRIIFVPGTASITITNPAQGLVTAVRHTNIVVAGTAADENGFVGTQIIVTNLTRGARHVSGAGVPAWVCSNVVLAGNTTNVLQAILQRMYGGEVTSGVVRVYADLAGPEVAITNPAGGRITTDVAVVTIAGTVRDAGSGVVSVRWENIELGTSGACTVQGERWQALVGVGVGVNTVRIESWDGVGNARAVTGLVWHSGAANINITIPTSTGTWLTNSMSCVIGGTAADANGLSNDKIIVTNRTSGSGHTLGGASAWQTPGLALVANQTNPVNAVLVRPLGYHQTSQLDIVVDAVAPQVGFSAAFAGTIVTDVAACVVSGTASDTLSGVARLQLFRNGVVLGDLALTGLPIWSTSVDLVMGSNQLVLTGWDRAGNSNSAASVILRRGGASIAMTQPAGGMLHYTNAVAINVGGTASDENGLETATIRVTNLARNAAAVVVTPAQTPWLVTGMQLMAGWTNELRAGLYRWLGTTEWVSCHVVCDTSPPSIVVSTPAGSYTITNASNMRISGTVADALSPVMSMGWSNSHGASGGISLGSLPGWQADVPLMLGSNSVFVFARDAAGNTSGVVRVVYRSGDASITITNPTASGWWIIGTNRMTVGGEASDQNGFAGTGVIVSNETLGQAWQVEPAAATWSVSGVWLQPGVTNLLRAKLRRQSGETIDTAPLVVICDTGAPSVVITNTIGELTTWGSNIVLRGTVRDILTGVSSMRWENVTLGSGGSVSIGAGDTWQATVGLAYGTNAVQVRAWDGAGNHGLARTNAVRMSTAIIGITVPSPGGWYATIQNAVPLGGYVSNSAGEGGATVTVSNRANGLVYGASVNGGVWDVGAVALVANQTNRCEATVRASYATNSSTAISIICDQTAPVLSITQPTGSTSITTAVSVQLQGTASDALTGVTAIEWTNYYTGGGGAIDRSSLPNWWQTVPLSLGTNVIRATAVDGAGNTSVVQHVAIRLVEYYSIRIMTPPAEPLWATNGGEVPEVSGTAVSSSGWSGVLLWISNDTAGVRILTTAQDTWSVVNVPLAAADGTNLITAQVMAGGVYKAGSSVRVIRDRVAPQVVVSTPGTPVSTVMINKVTLKGQAWDALSGLAWLQWTNYQTGMGGTLVPDVSNAWQVNSSLEMGSNVIVISAADRAGNVTSTWRVVERGGVSGYGVRITDPTTNGYYATNFWAFNKLRGEAWSEAGWEGLAVIISNMSTGSMNGPVPATSAWEVSWVHLGADNATNIIIAGLKNGNSWLASDRLLAVRDSVAPVITVQQPWEYPYVTTGAVVLMQGSVGDGLSGVRVMTSSNHATGVGAVVPVGSGGTWQVQIGLIQGTNVVELRAADHAGNSRSEQRVCIRMLPPEFWHIRIEKPEEGCATTNSVVEYVGGTAISSNGWSGEKIVVTNASIATYAVMIPAANEWAVNNIPLSSGSATNELRAWITLGGTNKAASSTRVIRDIEAPLVTIEQPSGAGTVVSVNTVRVSGRMTERWSGVERAAWTNWDTGQGGVVEVQSNWAWAIEVGLRKGTNDIHVIGWDRAGNEGRGAVRVVRVGPVGYGIAVTEPVWAGVCATNVSLLRYVRGTAYSESGWQNAQIVASNRANNSVRLVAGAETWQVNFLELVLNATNSIEISLIVDGVVRAVVVLNMIVENELPHFAVTLPLWESSARTNTSLIRWRGVAYDRMSGINKVTWTNTWQGTGGLAVMMTDATWRADVTLAEGSNQLVFACHDNAGNVSSIVQVVTVDSRGPHFWITVPASWPASTPFNRLVVAGVVWDEWSPPVSVLWSNFTQRSVGVASVGATGAWQTVVGLALGSNQVQFTAHDSLGNFSNLHVTIVRTGIVGHTICITQPTSEEEWVTKLGVVAVVGGTAGSETPWELLSILISNEATGWQTNIPAGPTWSQRWVPLTSISGTNVIRVTMRGASGDVGTDWLRVLADYEGPPAPALVQPPDGAVLTNAWPVLVWNTVADISGIAFYQVLLDNAETITVSGTSLEMQRALAYGSHTWRVRAVNGAGLTGPWSGERQFVITDVVGAIRLLAPSDGTMTNATRIRFTWQAEGVGTVQHVFVNGTQMANGLGMAVVDVVDGTNRWYVRGEQLSGTLVYSATNVLVVDTTPPSMTVRAPQQFEVVSGVYVRISVLVWDTISGVGGVTWTNETAGSHGVCVRSGNDEWVANAMLTPGTNVLAIEAWNGAGSSTKREVCEVAAPAWVIIMASAALYGFPDGSRGQLCFNRSLPAPVGCAVELVQVGSVPPAPPYSVEDIVSNRVLERSAIGRGKGLLGGYTPTNGEFALIYTAQCERLDVVVRTFSSAEPAASAYYDNSSVFRAEGACEYPVPIMRNVNVNPGYIIPPLGVSAAVTVGVDATVVEISGTAPSGWGDNQLPDYMLRVEWQVVDGTARGTESVYMGWWDARIPLSDDGTGVQSVEVRALSSSGVDGVPTGVWQRVYVYRCAPPVTNVLAVRITEPTTVGWWVTNVATLSLAGTYEGRDEQIAAITWRHVESGRTDYAHWASQRWYAVNVPCDWATNTLQVLLYDLSGQVVSDRLVVVQERRVCTGAWIRITEPTAEEWWETNALTVRLGGWYASGACTVAGIHWVHSESGRGGECEWGDEAWQLMAAPSDWYTNTIKVVLALTSGDSATDQIIVVRSTVVTSRVEVIWNWPRYVGVGQTGWCEFISDIPGEPYRVVWGPDPLKGGYTVGRGLVGSTDSTGVCYTCAAWVIDEMRLLTSQFGRSNTLWVVVGNEGAGRYGRAPETVWLVPDLRINTLREATKDIDGDAIVVKFRSKRGTVNVRGRSLVVSGTGPDARLVVSVSTNVSGKAKGDGYADIALVEVQNGSLKVFACKGDVDEIRLTNGNIRQIWVEGGDLGRMYDRRSRWYHGVVTVDGGVGRILVRSGRFQAGGGRQERGGRVSGDCIVARRCEEGGLLLFIKNGALERARVVCPIINRMVISGERGEGGVVRESAMFASGEEGWRLPAIGLVKARVVVDSRIVAAGDIGGIVSDVIEDTQAASRTADTERLTVVVAGGAENIYDIKRDIFLLGTWVGYRPTGVLRKYVAQEGSAAVLVSSMVRLPSGKTKAIKLRVGGDREYEQWYIDGVAMPVPWDGVRTREENK